MQSGNPLILVISFINWLASSLLSQTMTVNVIVTPIERPLQKLPVVSVTGLQPTRSACVTHCLPFVQVISKPCDRRARSHYIKFIGLTAVVTLKHTHCNKSWVYHNTCIMSIAINTITTIIKNRFFALKYRATDAPKVPMRMCLLVVAEVSSDLWTYSVQMGYFCLTDIIILERININYHYILQSYSFLFYFIQICSTSTSVTLYCTATCSGLFRSRN